MSVIRFTEITDGRSGGDDLDTNHRYTRTFQIYTSTAQDGAKVVLAHAELPQIGDTYEYINDFTGVPVTVTDADSVVVSRQADQPTDDLQNWVVTVEYAGRSDPTAEPADVEISPTRYQVALVEDLDEVPALNSADDPFDGGLPADRTRWTITVSKNILDFDHVAAADYQDSVNQEEFMGYAKGTLKLTFGAKRVRRLGNTGFYWVRTAIIEFRKEGWKAKVRDAGYRQFNSTKTGKIPIESLPGIPVSSPALLDGGGFALPTDSDPAEPVLAGPVGDGTDDPITGRGFRMYEVKDWAPLNLEW